MLLERSSPSDQTEQFYASCHPQIAVLLPCYNEAGGIAKVIEDFRQALPTASIYVCDNNSSDETVQIATDAGAIVRREPRQGKGHVVRRMFADIDADIYVMCDADDTYDASAASALVEALVIQGLDMVVGSRQQEKAGTYRPGHEFGNWMLSVLVRKIFGDQFRDMLSGYRVFSRRFVKSFPVMSGGFEIETELTIHALELEMPACEMPIRFSDRAPGSESKLRTFRDGFRILGTIINLLKQERPLQLFSFFALLLSLVSIVLAVPIVMTYLETGLVPRFPTAILSSALMLLGFLFFFSGLILQTVTRGRQEAKRMWYLAVPGVHATLDRSEGAR
ncbi:glycosyltransferase family 2 protein [Erythrobacter sp. MTPC3]|uniref:glycosyltransferase family 2 protein n=1 Tax=Erythrobacter sp. MTPC3 TaxID=3056564 RepID=UPI0036F3FB4D